MQSEVRPESLGPRTTRYFSAPGFKTGPAAATPPRPPAPPPAPSYTPDRSGLPFDRRGTFTGAGAALEIAAPPVTTTVTSFVATWLFAPRAVRMYFVVAVG